MGPATKVELTFDPGDLGQVNVLDPAGGTYIRVPAVDRAYARGLSLWQNKVIPRYAHRQLKARTDMVALAQANAEIRALVDRDFNRKSTRGRKRHARFLETSATPQSAPDQPTLTETADEGVPGGSQPVPEMRPGPEQPGSRIDAFSDDEILPVFEADLDLPRLPGRTAGVAKDSACMEDAR